MKKKIKKKGIGGWLLFFIITVFISLIAFLISDFLDINMLIRRFRFDSMKKIVELSVHIIYSGLFIYFTAYTIYSLIKKHLNAVSLAKMYLVIITLITLFEPFYNKKPSGIYYCIIFLLYFSYSDRVNNTFPKSKRIIKKNDQILFALLASLFFIYSYINIPRALI